MGSRAGERVEGDGGCRRAVVAGGEGVTTTAVAERTRGIRDLRRTGGELC